MSILPFRTKETVNENRSTKYIEWYTRLAHIVIKQPIRLSVVSFLAIGALTYLANKNSFNDEFINYFDESVKFRNDTDYISENLTGVYNVEYSVGSGESGGYRQG